MTFSRIIAARTNTLSGVADALEDTKAKTIILGRTKREGYFHEVVPNIERVLRHLHDRLDHGHDSLCGHVFLTSRVVKHCGAVYQRFAISVDKINCAAADGMLDELPSEFFTSSDDSICLSKSMSCISAKKAAHRLRLIDEADRAGNGHELAEPIEILPYEFDKVQPPYFGRFACYLGARSTVKSVSFMAED